MGNAKDWLFLAGTDLKTAKAALEKDIPEQANQAIKYAEQVFNFIKEKIK